MRHYSSKTCSQNIGSYLAGLIEGDGHIAVHDKNSKSKVYRPKIIIVFHINDRPLAERLSAVLKVGIVVSRSSAGHVLLQILAKEEVFKIINLINGHMRTPKIEAFAEYFTVNLYTRTRTVEDRVFYALITISHNSRSYDIVRNYFDRFPIYSSKYLAYKDWCRVQDLHRVTSLSKETLDEIKAIKDQFNSKRKVFDFSHLDSLTF